MKTDSMTNIRISGSPKCSLPQTRREDNKEREARHSNIPHPNPTACLLSREIVVLRCNILD